VFIECNACARTGFFLCAGFAAASRCSCFTPLSSFTLRRCQCRGFVLTIHGGDCSVTEEIVAIIVPHISYSGLLLFISILTFTSQVIRWFQRCQLFVVKQELDDFAGLRDIREIFIANDDILNLEQSCVKDYVQKQREFTYIFLDPC